MNSAPRAAAETTASAAGVAADLSRATGELERLRAALNTKLATLEAALENPDASASIETLVIDLARVATREADAAATRACLEAQLVVEQHKSAPATTDSDRAALQGELDAARREVEELRTAVQTGRAAERALRQAVEAAEQRVFVTETIKARELSDLRDQLDLEHAAEHESNRAEVTRLEQAMEALRLQLAAARDASHSQRGDVDAWQRRIEAADQRVNELEQLLHAAGETANQQLAAMQAIQARLDAAEQGAAEQERRHQEQIAAITDSARTEVTALAAELDALRDAGNANAEMVAQLAASNAERDRLAAEVAEIRTSTGAALDAAERRYEDLCESTGARIRDLELKLVAHAAQPARMNADHDSEEVEQDLGAELWDEDGGDQAIDIGSMSAEAPSLLIPPARRTERHPISGNVEIQVDEMPATLVDLSVNGAQILSTTALKPNRAVALLLPVGGRSVLCKGKIVWARLEASSETLRYRGGIFFTHVDQRAIETFLNGGTASQPNAAAPSTAAEGGQSSSQDADRERHAARVQAAASGR